MEKLKAGQTNYIVCHGKETHPVGEPCDLCDRVKKETEIPLRFFTKLEEQLDCLFPKGCKERGKAILFNSLANQYLIEALKEQKAEIKTDLLKVADKNENESLRVAILDYFI